MKIQSIAIVRGVMKAQESKVSWAFLALLPVGIQPFIIVAMYHIDS